MHICIHLYVIRDIRKSLLFNEFINRFKVLFAICLDQCIFNVRNRRTVKKYDVGRNAKSIIKRLYQRIDMFFMYDCLSVSKSNDEVLTCK